MGNNRQTLQQLWQRGCDFTGQPLAIIGGAMTWVSNPTLTAAISNAGGLGVLACGSMNPSLLEQAIASTRELTNQSFGVNLIVMHPELDALVDVCVKAKVPHVMLAGGLPTAGVVERLRQGPAKIWAFASAYVLGVKLKRMGVDALIVEGHEAGGHIGPISTTVLVQEMQPLMASIPVFVAGGIGRGDMIAAYLRMGAAGCQLGTRFVCAHESPAHPAFKNAMILARARDAVVSSAVDPRFPVIPVRALSNEATQAFQNFQVETIAKHHAGELDLQAAQLEIEHFWAGALRRAVMDGDVVRGSIMAGQSVAFVDKEQSVKEIMDELVEQACASMESFAR